MNYAKYSKKQQRKQLQAARKQASQRSVSAYGVKRRGSSGKMMAGFVLLASFIANAGEINALALSLL